jgi:hypothetical protein
LNSPRGRTNHRGGGTVSTREGKTLRIAQQQNGALLFGEPGQDQPDQAALFAARPPARCTSSNSRNAKLIKSPQ